MFRRTAVFVALIAAALSTSACLLKDTSETWYIDPTGTVTWAILERDVRSDADALADRLAEETAYRSAVEQGNHPVAAGLRELGASSPRTVVLRAEAPFTVLTEGQFPGLDELGRRLLAGLGLAGSSVLTHEGPDWEWTLVMRDPKATGATAQTSENIDALVGDLDSLTVVLVSGRFESADGFDLSSDRRSATITRQALSPDDDRPAITLRLKWKGGPIS